MRDSHYFLLWVERENIPILFPLILKVTARSPQETFALEGRPREWENEAGKEKE